METLQRIEILKSRIQYLKNKLSNCNQSIFKITLLAYTTAQYELSLLENQKSI